MNLSEAYSVVSDAWGTLPDGRPVQRFTLSGPGGLSVQLSDYGARIVRVLAPDHEGRAADVTLHHTDLAAYLDASLTPFFGAVVGRCANRIAQGRFVLDGEAYSLPINNPPNTLHGGPGGLDTVLWSGAAVQEPGLCGAEFAYHSPDGDQGYPGALNVTVRYTLEASGTLAFRVRATCTRPTPVNISNHAYWNLADVRPGHSGAGSVLHQRLTLGADRFLPVDTHMIPTGQQLSVQHTPFDFRQPKPVGQDLHADHEQLRRAGGYDHHFVLTAEPNALPGHLRWAATLSDAGSGRQLELWTTEPGLQLYSGNVLNGGASQADGAGYAQHSAVCLEPQHAPDAPNQPQLGNVILRPGEEYLSHSEWRFSAQEPDVRMERPGNVIGTQTGSLDQAKMDG